MSTVELIVKGVDQASDVLGGIGKIAGGLALGGVAAFGAAVVSGIAGAREAAQVQAQTAQVIKTTGEAAGVSAQHVTDYAGALSDAAGQSLFSGEQVQQSTNLLLTFTNIKGTVLDAATSISVDMAQALGGAPKDAAIQLGKALNDPIAGVSALSRVGVSFDEQQKATIKTMVETGNVAGAQQIILNELNKEFGGSAKAAADADGGWAQFTARIGDAEKGIGTALLPILAKLGGVLDETVAPAIETAAGLLSALISGDMSGATDILNKIFPPETTAAILGTMASIQTIVQSLFTALQTGDFGPFLDNLSALGEQVGPIFDGLIESASNWIAEAVPPFLEKAGTFLASMIQWASDSAPGWLQSLLQLADAAGQWIVEAVPPFLEKAGQFYQAMIDWVLASLPGWIGQLQSLAMAATQWVVDALPGLGSNLGTFAGQLLGWIVQLAADVVPKILVLALHFIEWVATTVIPALPGALLAIATGIFNFVTTLSAQVVPKIAEVSAKFVGWVQTDVIPKLPGALEAIKTTIGDWISGAVSWAARQAASIGQHIIDGIISGVSNGVDALTGAVQHAAQSALDAAKRLLGISSPSRVFQDEVGAQIPAGIAAGIIGGFDGVIDTINAYTGKAADEAKKAVANLAKEIHDLARSELSGSASLDRSRAGALNDLAGLLPASKDVDDVGKKIADVNAQIATAQQGLASSDADERAKASQQLGDLFTQRQQLLDQQTQLQQAQERTRQIAADAQQQLQQADAEAAKLRASDPKLAADYFALRRKQIIELAKLQQDATNATSDDERQRIQEQISLITAAQQAELQGFQSDAAQRQREIANLVTLPSTTNAGLNELLQELRDMLLPVAGAMQQLGTLIPDIPTTPTIPGAQSGGGAGLAATPGPSVTFAAGAIVVNGGSDVAAQVEKAVSTALAKAGLQADARRRSI